MSMLLMSMYNMVRYIIATDRDVCTTLPCIITVKLIKSIEYDATDVHEAHLILILNPYEWWLDITSI